MDSFWPHTVDSIWQQFELQEVSHTSAAESTAAHCAEKATAAMRAKWPQRHSYAGVFKAALYAESCCRLSYSSTRISLRPFCPHGCSRFFSTVWHSTFRRNSAEKSPHGLRAISRSSYCGQKLSMGFFM